MIKPGGRVLDLACGSGRHVRFLQARGFQVTAVDLDITKVADLKDVTGVEIVQANLEDGSPWPLGSRKFDGVVVSNYLWRPLFPILINILDEGGVLIYETFAIGNEKYGKPSRPDFLLRPRELIEMVTPSLHIMSYEHGIEMAPKPSVRQRICAINDLQPRPLNP